MSTKNPWLGLASYEEPKGTANDFLFCGRDEETLDVVRLIDNNLFITLYGSSGIGKTSLLRAGVMPILRRRDYFPVYVRLSQEPDDISYAEAIVRKLQSSGMSEERNAAISHTDGTDRLYLWSYFATTRFFLNEREVYPVVILDQFEEVFRDKDKTKAELLLQQVYLLLNDELEMPEEEGYSADTNYRFVASIREDFLFVLEDSIDELSLDLYKNNRYRLRPMKPEQARQVVLVPGKDCIEESQKNEVSDRIVALAQRGKSGDIDTLLLSLVCAGTYDKKAGSKITLDDLSVWKDNPMELYYQDAVRSLSATQVRYIQQHLIREDGSRRRVESQEVKAALGDSTYNQLSQGSSRLLTLDDQGQVELLHDQLALAVYEERKAFEERERKKRLRQRVTVAGAILLILAGIFLIQNHRLKQQRWKMMENQARFVAEKASQLVDEGNSYLAQRLLLEILPIDLNHPDRPYCVEAESTLRKAVTNNNAILRGHTSYVSSAAYSPDGKRIVSASMDNTIRIWDAETGRQIGKPLEGHTEWVKSAAFSPDGKRIVSAAWDGTIRIWDAKTGKQIGQSLEGNVINSAAFSPDGKRIVSASQLGTIQIWDAKTGRQIGKPLEGPSSAVYSASFSPDGKRIVSASMDNTIRIWDAETGRQIGKPLEGHTQWVYSAAFSPDGKRIVSASGDKTIRIWDAETGKQIGKPLEGHTSVVNFAAFRPDGKRIVSASWDGTIRIWDAETGCQIGNMLNKNTDEAYSVSFSLNENRIKTTDGHTIQIWDTTKNPTPHTLIVGVAPSKLSSQEVLFIKSINDTSSRIFRVTKGIYSASFSPNGKYVVSASGDNTIKIWNTSTGKQTGKTLKGHSRDVRIASFSPDGSLIVSASLDSTIRLWDIKTGKQIGQTIKLQCAFIYSIIFSPDNKRILSIADNSIQIWDRQTGKQIGKSLEIPSNITSAAFSQDGKLIVSASYDDNTIQIWETETGKKIGNPLKGHVGSVNSVSFSPNKMRIVSASDDYTIRLWDVTTGQQIGQPLDRHSEEVLYATFSPDGKYIVSASGDKTVRIWDAETGKQIGNSLEGHSMYVFSANFSPDGRRIVSASSDGTIRIWDFPPLQELIDQTRERFKDYPLTPEERRQYYLE